MTGLLVVYLIFFPEDDLWTTSNKITFSLSAAVLFTSSKTTKCMTAVKYNLIVMHKRIYAATTLTANETIEL